MWKKLLSLLLCSVLVFVGVLTQSNLTSAVPSFVANSVAKFDTANIMVGLTVPASTIVGRKAAGGIVALTGAEVLSLLNFTNVSLFNILTNGSFEVGDPPTGWIMINVQAVPTRDVATVKIGTYSVKLVNGAVSDDFYYRSVPDVTYYRSRVVRLGCWVWCASANKARLLVTDGHTDTYSTYHTGDSTWQWLTASMSIHAAAGIVYAGPWISTSVTAYYDGCFLVEGDSCPAFSPKPDENLINHHTAAYTISAFETGHVLHTNLGAGGAIQLELPQTVTAGFTCRFAVMAAFELRIHPGAAGAIYINGAKQLDDKYITADDEAESIILTADGNGDWIASSVVGTWGVE